MGTSNIKTNMGVELWAKPYGDKSEVLLLGTFWGTT
jgi:hypothetical protein